MFPRRGGQDVCAEVDVPARYAEVLAARLERPLRTISMPIASGKHSSHSNGDARIGSCGSAGSCSKFMVDLYVSIFGT